jgi:LacI family transcriptional regulator
VAITIKQIAERAGLSVPTVSRILNNDAELFRPETRDKVLTAARELGYRPNSYRMALRTKRFNSIGLLFSADPCLSALSHETQCVLLQELHRRDQHLVAGQAGTAVSNGDGHGEASLPKMLREWSVDGLLIDGAAAASAAVEELIQRTSIPAIWLNVKRATDCVYPDEFAGAREGTERLLKLGHKRIMFMDLAHHRASDRQAGYEAAMKAAGLSPRVVAPDPVDRCDRAVFLSDWIGAHRAPDFPTAIFCSDVDTAMPLYVAACRAGLDVPGDLSILAIHDRHADCLGVRISIMCLPAADVALQGLKALDEKIADPNTALPPRSLPLRYEEGATMSPAPSHQLAHTPSGS